MAPAYAIRSKESNNQAPSRSNVTNQAPSRSKVTKVIKQAALRSKVTKKASKSAPKATKAKTPPPRKEILISTTSLDIITPDEIEETSPLSTRVNIDKLIA